MGQMRSNPCTACVGAIGYGNSLAFVLASRTPGQIQLHGFHDFTAAERGSRRTSAKKDLIDVVVQDGAEPFKVMLAELNADALRKRVADRVRMAKTLRSTTSTSRASGEAEPIVWVIRSTETLPRLSRSAHGCPPGRVTILTFEPCFRSSGQMHHVARWVEWKCERHDISHRETIEVF